MPPGARGPATVEPGSALALRRADRDLPEPLGR